MYNINLMKVFKETPTYKLTTADADKKVYTEQAKLIQKHEKCLTNANSVQSTR